MRITDEIGSAEAFALIQATRSTLLATMTGSSTAPDTAIMIHPYNDSYLVSWGSAEGYQKVTLQARRTDGGKPANPEDWHTDIYALGN